YCKDFLEREAEQSQSKDTMLSAIRNTYKNVKTHNSRVYKAAHLLAFKGTGSAVVGVIQNNLWSESPPAPPSAEEIEIENRQEQAAAKEKQRVKELNKKRKAEEKAAAAVAAARDGCTGGAGPDPLRGGFSDENGIPPGEEAAELGSQAGRKKSKTSKAKQEYIPGPGTANWVFLLMLVKHLRGSKTFMTKTELIDTAEASGLSAKPIKGGSVTSYHGGPPTGFVYDGWSCFATMCNREPPLCVQYSNPKKIKLTPDGEQLALRIYLDAAATDRLTWRIPGIPVPSGAEGMPQPALAPAMPQAAPPRPPSQAFQNQSHASHGAYSQHGSTPASVQGNSRRGRALEPQGPSNSPEPSQRISFSGRPKFSDRPNPSTARVGSLQTGLLSHPSTSLTVDEEEPSLAQRLSQSLHRSQAYSTSLPYSDLQPFSHSASQGIQARGAAIAQPGSELGSPNAGKQPFAERRSAKRQREEQTLKVMEFTECSYKKARKVLKRTLTVEDAIESVFQLSSESESGDNADDDDDEGNDLAHVGSQHMHHMSDDYEIPMGASQSANPAPISVDISHQGTVPAQKRPPKAAFVQTLHTQPASIHHGLDSQAPALSHSQQLNMSRQHSGSGSGSLGSGVGRGGSLAGAAGPSRLGAAGQGRASGCSQQASQGAGHIAQLESSGTSWKLPFLGAGGILEETDIRLPPLPSGACFRDEYELMLIIDSREQYSNAGKDRADGLAAKIQVIRDRGVSVDIRALQQGDVLWIAHSRRHPGVEYVLDYVLERKRVDDMAGSIKSRRYDRQKFNMNMCGLRHLVYLVEGNPDTLGNESGMRHTPSVSNTTHPLTDCMPMPTSCYTKAVKTGTIQTQVIDGFQILRSEHSSQTMLHLVEWTKALKRKYDHLMASHPQVQRGGDPLPTLEVFRAKSAQMQKRTVQDVWGLILTSVPGWSGAMAEAVVKQYGTPLLLFKAYEQAIRAAAQQGRNPTEAARQLLMSCQLSRNRRPISANNSARVFDSLFANGWQCI
ncbi:MAG: crossover junction endonuclease MUS81-like, partial [Trebouxia sp. A1-2]